MIAISKRPRLVSVWVADIAKKKPLYLHGLYSNPDEAEQAAIDAVIYWNGVSKVEYSPALVSIWGAPENRMTLITPDPEPSSGEGPIAALIDRILID